MCAASNARKEKFSDRGDNCQRNVTDLARISLVTSCRPPRRAGLTEFHLQNGRRKRKWYRRYCSRGETGGRSERNSWYHSREAGTGCNCYHCRRRCYCLHSSANNARHRLTAPPSPTRAVHVQLFRALPGVRYPLQPFSSTSVILQGNESRWRVFRVVPRRVRIVQSYSPGGANTHTYPADATAIPKPHHLLPHSNPD